VTTLSAATWLYRTKMAAAAAQALKKPTAEKGEEREGVHTLGPADASVVLEEFGDFQCPPCGMLAEPLNEMAKEFPKLRVVFKNFPLVMHQHAMEAAHAAEAAGLQGHFWEMHDLLYREQSVWSKAADVRELFVSYAAMLKCNTMRFKKDIDSEEVAKRVSDDQEEGKKLGVTNTPTIFINNEAVPPPRLSPADLHEAIEEAMKNPRPPATPAPAASASASPTAPSATSPTPAPSATIQ